MSPLFGEFAENAYFCSVKKRDMESKFTHTEAQFSAAMAECRSIFEKKLADYGASWRILRPSSLTDQLYIKAKRIRQLETCGESLVGEGIRPEFAALVNYGLVGLIQLTKGYADRTDMTPAEALVLYDHFAASALELMRKKNHDYFYVYRSAPTAIYTDFILTKLQRIKEIEENCGVTTVSEGIDSNYMDIINYAVFGLIKLGEQRE